MKIYGLGKYHLQYGVEYDAPEDMAELIVSLGRATYEHPDNIPKTDTPEKIQVQPTEKKEVTHIKKAKRGK